MDVKDCNFLLINDMNFHTMLYCVVAYFKPNFNSIAYSDGSYELSKYENWMCVEDPFCKSSHK